MRSKIVAQLLIDLGVAKSHSRPNTPTDNPYSASQFKTMKYRPEYPDWFQDPREARDWARNFFRWYKHEHHHSGLGLMTPAVVHYGLADEVYEQRRQVLAAAYKTHPERFVQGEPRPARWPDEVWINPPQPGHVDIAPVDPVSDEAEPDAQPGSPARLQRSADIADYLLRPERTSERPDDAEILHPKFQHGDGDILPGASGRQSALVLLTAGARRA
jgi:hypothetical protein